MNRNTDRQDYRDRPARIDLRCDALLTESDGCELSVTILDISKEGFRLRSRCELEAGSEVDLSVAKLPAVRARILWVRGEEAGGIFLDPVAV